MQTTTTTGTKRGETKDLMSITNIVCMNPYVDNEVSKFTLMLELLIVIYTLLDINKSVVLENIKQ